MAHHLIIYTRISTRTQTTDAQDGALATFASSIPHSSIEHITDTCSGSTPWKSRRLASAIHPREDQTTLLCAELSRLGRSTLDVLDFLAEAAKAGITVRALKGNLTVDDSISSKVLTTILALASELERDFIRARTREGLTAAAAQGRKGGRPPGRSPTHSLDPHATEIRRLMAAQVSKNAAARLLGVSRNTLYRYLARERETVNPTQN